jgi:hypothetical protein
MASKMGYKGEIEKGKTKSMGGMKQVGGPKEHFEKKMDNLDGCDLRYASEMNAAAEYKAANDGLKNYVRKHKMNYYNGQ